MAADNTHLVRLGILGCASIAWKLVRAMLQAGGVAPYAVGSRSLEKARGFVEQMKKLDSTCQLIPYGSYDEVLKDPNVDAVYIPLPTGLHLEWVVKAAEHGKHILLEKPVSLNMAELDLMLAACKKAGVQIMDGTMWVHNPRAAAVKQVLQDRERLGELRRININFFFKASEDFLHSNIRVQKGLDELGCLGDLGWYCIKAALWAKDFQLPFRVIALPDTVKNEQGVFLTCGATLLWDDGTVATFDCGFTLPLRQVLQLAGTNGTVLLDDFTIPHREDESVFKLELQGELVDCTTRSVVGREEVRLRLQKPQEVIMVEVFADLVRGLKAEGASAVSGYWEDVMWKTQRIVSAVQESANAGCSTVEVTR